MLESRLSLRVFNHVQWTCNRLGQRAWSTWFFKYERSIVKKDYSIFLHQHLNFSFSKRMYSIWCDQARGWTWMLGQGTPAGTRHRPAQNSTLGMIGFENNCLKKDKWKKGRNIYIRNIYDLGCEILSTLRGAFRDLRALSFALAW